MAAILNFGGHFGSYIDYYKFETFLVPNKTFVDIFIGFCKKLFNVDVIKIFLNQIAVILELATLIQKIRDGNIPGKTENI